MNKFGLHTFGLPSFGISDFRLTSFGGDGDGGRKAALPSPDLYYDLSLKSNEHPTRNIIDDMSGNGRHATIYNALYAEGSGYGESGYEGAFVFDGIDDYARIENITKGFKTLFMEVVPFKTGGMLFGQSMTDGVQVGGRNYLTNSMRVDTSFGYATRRFQETLYAGEYILSFLEIESSKIDLPETYSSLILFDNEEDSMESFHITIGREKKHAKIVTKKDHSFAYLYSGSTWAESNNRGVVYKMMKLESGNKATDWSPAPEDVFAISNLPNTIAYNERNPNGVTYINGELSTNKYTDDMQNHRQVITIVNPTDTTHGSASIGAFSGLPSSMALYKIIGFYDELTPEQIQRVITKYNLKYEQI